MSETESLREPNPLKEPMRMSEPELRKRVRAILREAARNSRYSSCATYAQYDHFSAELRKLDLPPELHREALEALVGALGV